MSNICCYPLGFTIWYQVLILTGWNFISSYPLGPLSYSRLVDNYLVRPPHCFTVCVYHIIFHLIFAVCPTSYPTHLPSPSSITPNSSIDTLCVLLCNSVPSPHPSITSSYCTSSDSGIHTHCFVLLFVLSSTISFGRQLSGVSPHCFSVWASHHLSPHLCWLSHLIPLPLAITPITHPNLLPLTHCVSYCVTVYPLHNHLSPHLIVHPQTQVSHPLFRLTVYPAAQPSRLVDNYLVYPLIASLCEYHIIFHLIFAGCPTSYPSHLLSPSSITPTSSHWHTACLTV